MQQTTRSTARHPARWATLALALSPSPGIAQEVVPDSALDRAIRDLGGAYAHLISFAAEPEISASYFNIDSGAGFDSEISVLKVPLYREFDVEGRDWNWYAQAAFSSLDYTEEGDVGAGLGEELIVDAKYKAYSGVAEAGLIFPLGSGFYFAPGFGVGGSRLSNETRISDTPVGNIIESLLDGRAINWDTNAVFARANLGLLYRNRWGATKVRASTHFVYSEVQSYNESERFDSFSSNNGSLSAKLDLAYPLAWTISDEPVYLVGHAAATSFVGAPRDDLGFDHFYEVGVALGYRQVAIGIQAVLGPDVEGATVSLDYGF